jgi:hypothetical protein
LILRGLKILAKTGIQINATYLKTGFSAGILDKKVAAVVESRDETE